MVLYGTTYVWSSRVIICIVHNLKAPVHHSLKSNKKLLIPKYERGWLSINMWRIFEPIQNPFEPKLDSKPFLYFILSLFSKLSIRVILYTCWEKWAVGGNKRDSPIPSKVGLFILSFWVSYYATLSYLFYKSTEIATFYNRIIPRLMFQPVPRYTP